MTSIDKSTLEGDRERFLAEFERAQGRQQRATEEMLRIDGTLIYIDQLIQFITTEEQPKAEEKDEKPKKE